MVLGRVCGGDSGGYMMVMVIRMSGGSSGGDGRGSGRGSGVGSAAGSGGVLSDGSGGWCCFCVGVLHSSNI